MSTLRDCGGSMEKWMIHLFHYVYSKKHSKMKISLEDNFDSYYYDGLVNLKSEFGEYFERNRFKIDAYIPGAEDINPQLKALIDTYQFRMILTTNYDPLLETYLRELWEKEGETLQVKNIMNQASLTGRSLSGLSKKKNIDSLEKIVLPNDLPPTLYYLFGKASEKSYYAALEEDKIFAIRKWIKHPPESLMTYLKDKLLIAVGCKFDDWLFRFFWFGALERDKSPISQNNDPFN